MPFDVRDNTPSSASSELLRRLADRSRIESRYQLRGEIARHVNLKFAPDIRFRIDQRFDEAERIEKLLRTPQVQRDLSNKTEDEN